MIIAVLNTKGGTGKTTTSMFLAQQLSGYVLKSGKTPGAQVWDADPQGSALQWAKAAKNLPFEVLAVNDKVLKELYEKKELNKKKNVAKPYGSTFVIIDCPPNPGTTFAHILRVADIVIVPMKTGLMDVERGVKTMSQLTKGGVPVVVPLLTMVNRRTRSFREISQYLQEKNPHLFSEPSIEEMSIRNLEFYSEAFGHTIEDTNDYEGFAQFMIKTYKRINREGEKWTVSS